MRIRLLTLGVIAAATLGIGGAQQIHAAPAPPPVVFVDDNCNPPADGSLLDPFCTIQEGVNTVAASGTVIVRPGNYPELVNISKKIILQGPSSGGVATVNNLNLNSNGITVTRFSIVGGSGPVGNDYGITTSAAASGYTIAYNEISGGDGGVNYASNGTLPNTITQNSIHDNNGLGFGIFGSGAISNTTISYNKFENLLANSVRSFTPSTKVTILHNTSTNVVAPFNIANLSNFSISNNLNNGFTTGGSGIYLPGGNSNGTIDFNTITGTGNQPDQGIFFNDTFGTNSNLKIRNNTVSGMAGNGILVNPSSLTSSSISNNNIFSNGNGQNATDGIKINDSGNSGLTISYNRLKNNFEHDLHDNTGGSGTAGTANNYLFNFCNSSSPAGLCQFPNP